MADTKPAIDRDTLRISIAETVARTDGHTWGPGQSSLPSGVIERYHRLADAVLAVLPAPDQRAAVLLEAADVGENVANRIHASGDDHRAGGAYDVVDELRRLAGEAQQDPTQDGEDPARIDRLRPEFTEHASVEAIDVQTRRARRQQTLWERRVQKLTSLRQTRVAQKERGEWPASVARPGQPETDAAKSERDDARNIAVTLEQQNARALELLETSPEGWLGNSANINAAIAVLCGDCEHHPDAPVIGGMCGGCTQYPDDTRRGEL